MTSAIGFEQRRQQAASAGSTTKTDARPEGQDARFGGGGGAPRGQDARFGGGGGRGEHDPDEDNRISFRQLAQSWEFLRKRNISL